jgi:putative prophage ps3 protein 01
LKKIKINQTIRGKEYTFEITAVFCNECGGEMGIPGLMDYNMKEIDEQYRSFRALDG